MKFYSIQKQVIDYINEIANLKIGVEESDVLKTKKSELEDIIDKTDSLEQAQKDVLNNILKQGLDIKLEDMFGNEPLVVKHKSEYVDKLDPAGREKFITDYKKILIYCKIAHVFENNGIAQEHAIKLTILFGNFNNAIKTLSAFSNQTKKGGGLQGEGAFVHEACLFDLPDNKPEDKTWQAVKKLLTDPANFADAELRKITNCINDVASYYNDDKDFTEFDNDKLLEDDDIFKIEQYNNLKTNSETKIERRFKTSYLSLAATDLDAKIKLIAQEIKDIRKAVNNVKSKPVKAGSDEASKREKNLKLLNKQLNTVLELYAVCQKQKGLSFENILKDKTALSGVYKKYLLSTSPELKLLVKYGLNQQNIARFQSLDRANTGSQIPYLLVTHDDHPEYYMRKLDVVNNPQDAAKAACLGKITGCCQSIGGAGNDCAIHGLTSPNGGFYVLCKKKSEDSDSDFTNDTIVAQSWAWRSTDNGLVMDSVEFNRGFAGDNTKIILEDLYNATACELADKHDIPLVYLGYGGYGDTPAALGFSVNGIVGIPRDYSGYRDSKQQRILTAKIAPYLKQADNLSVQERDNKTQKILNEKLSIINLDDLHKDIFFQFMAQYMTFDAKMYKKLFGLLDDSNKQKFEDFVKLNNELLDAIDKKDVDKLINALQNGACNTLIDSKGNNLIHGCCFDLRAFKFVVTNNYSNDITSVLSQVNNSGYSVFWYVTENIEILKYVIGLIPEDDLFYLLSIKTDFNATVLDHAIMMPGALKVILESISRAGQLKILKPEDKHAGNMLTSIADNHCCLRDVLEFYPKEHLLDDIMEINKFGHNVLYKSASDLATLKMVLACFPAQQHADLIMRQYKVEDRESNLISMRGHMIPARNYTLLQNTKRDHDALKFVLEFYPDNERLAQLKQPVGTHDQQFLLHSLITSLESLQVILDLLPADDYFSAFEDKNGEGYNLLQKLSSKPEILKAALNLYPQQQLPDVIIRNGLLFDCINDSNKSTLMELLNMLPDDIRKLAHLSNVNHGQNLLKRLCEFNSSDVMLKELKLYKEPQRFELIKRYDLLLYASFHLTNGLILEFLQYYPTSQMFDALDQKDIFGTSILSKLSSKPDVLISILKLLSPKDKIRIFNYNVYDGNSLLKHLSGHDKYLSELMTLMPESEKINLISNNVTIYTMLKNLDIFEHILNSYTIDQLTDKLKLVIGHVSELSILMLHPDLYLIILARIPNSKLIQLIADYDAKGDTVLKHTAKHCIDSLKVILSFLRNDQRREVLESQYIHESSFSCSILDYIKTKHPERYQEILDIIDQPSNSVQRVVGFSNKSKDSDHEHNSDCSSVINSMIGDLDVRSI